MEQYFVILKEEMADDPPALSGPNRVPLSTRGHPSDWRGSQRSRGFRSQRSRRGVSPRGRGQVSTSWPRLSGRGRASSHPPRDETRKRQLDFTGDDGTPSKRTISSQAETVVTPAEVHPEEFMDALPTQEDV